MDFVNGRQLSLGGGRRSDLGNVEGVVPSSAAEQTLFSADQVRRCFVILPGFVTPAWAKGAVMYQIFVDRFLQRRPVQRRAVGSTPTSEANAKQVRTGIQGLRPGRCAPFLRR